VRLTDFWARLEAVFGPAYAASVAADQVLSGLNGRTVNQALHAGVPTVAVWRAVCAAYPDRVPAKLK
jgi:thiamine monophosphate synthase